MQNVLEKDNIKNIHISKILRNVRYIEALSYITDISKTIEIFEKNDISSLLRYQKINHFRTVLFRFSFFPKQVHLTTNFPLALYLLKVKYITV